MTTDGNHSAIGGNIQSSARTVRYALLENAADALNCQRIATAHQRRWGSIMYQYVIAADGQIYRKGEADDPVAPDVRNRATPSQGDNMTTIDTPRLDEAAASVRQQEGGTHADEIETSMMLYIEPSAVDMKLAVKEFTPSSAMNQGL